MFINKSGNKLNEIARQVWWVCVWSDFRHSDVVVDADCILLMIKRWDDKYFRGVQYSVHIDTT